MSSLSDFLKKHRGAVIGAGAGGGLSALLSVLAGKGVWPTVGWGMAGAGAGGALGEYLSRKRSKKAKRGVAKLPPVSPVEGLPPTGGNVDVTGSITGPSVYTPNAKPDSSLGIPTSDGAIDPYTNLVPQLPRKGTTGYPETSVDAAMGAMDNPIKTLPVPETVFPKATASGSSVMYSMPKVLDAIAGGASNREAVEKGTFTARHLYPEMPTTLDARMDENSFPKVPVSYIPAMGRGVVGTAGSAVKGKQLIGGTDIEYMADPDRGLTGRVERIKSLIGHPAIKDSGNGKAWRKIDNVVKDWVDNGMRYSDPVARDALNIAGHEGLHTNQITKHTGNVADMVIRHGERGIKLKPGYIPAKGPNADYFGSALEEDVRGRLAKLYFKRQGIDATTEEGAKAAANILIHEPPKKDDPEFIRDLKEEYDLKSKGPDELAKWLRIVFNDKLDSSTLAA